MDKNILLHRIHPELRKFILEIWDNGKIGICAGNIQLTSVASSSKVDECTDMKYANRFTFSIPFAGHLLEWEVIFSNDDLSYAPDFYIPDDDFLDDCDAQILSSRIPSLVNWNSDNPNCLIQVITELLDWYKKYQIKMLESEKYSRLNFEYSSLIGDVGIENEDVEVLVELSGVVHFLIALDIDFSTLPPYIYKTDNSSDTESGTGKVDPATSMLLITFRGLDGSNISRKLFLSPHAEQALGGAGKIKIPPFNGCLLDYVPEVRKLLTDRIKFIIENYNLKCNYISQLLIMHGVSIIEYDALSYSQATLLFETKKFYWLLKINLGNNFPKDTPKWILRSIYHMSNSEPYEETLKDYPYSPRWCPEEMINRAFKFTLEYVQIFQTNSLKFKKQI